MFDNTITMGNLIQIVAMLLGGLYFLYTIKQEIALLANSQRNFVERLGKIDTDLAQLANVTIEIARQGERMTAQDRRLQELSNRMDDLGKITKLLLPPARARRNRD